MRKLTTAVLIVAILPALARAADTVPMVSFTVPAPVVGSAAGHSQFTGEQIARVSGWIREVAPEAPPAITPAAAQSFLDDLQEQNPGQVDRLLAPDFPVHDYDSALLRQAAAHLSGPTLDPVRQTLALRRAGAVLAHEGQSGLAPAQIAGLVGKIKDLSDVRYRSLLEGRMEDDDLAFYLQREREGEAAPVAAQPEGMTADEIVSAYARKNQTGEALQRWNAYMMEGRLKPATGDEQQVFLFKMRPDRFRLNLLVGGTVRYTLAGDGQRYWQVSAGRTVQIVPPEKMGARIYLAEFADPLFAAENYSFKRIANGGAEGKGKFYRIVVRRTDGSGYVTQIDAESYREIGREEDDGSSERFSDFRDVGGVTVAFREEVTDRKGRKSVMQLARVTPNPGLIRDFFDPLGDVEKSSFDSLSSSGASSP